VIVLMLAPSAVGAQTPAPAPSTLKGPAPASAIKADAIQRVAELIAKSSGPYKQIAPGIWETTYQGKNLPVIRVRIAAAEDGVFFIVPLFARDKLALSQAFLLRVAEFNAEYDYVKLALDKKWTTGDVWGGLNSKIVQMAPYTNMPDDVKKLAMETEAAITAGKLHPFKCPVLGQDGKAVECKGGANLDDGQILSMNYFIKGIDDKLPGK